MQKIILISLLAVVSFGALKAEFWCDCEDFTSQNECNNVVDCKWGSACAKKACSEIDLTVCETLDGCSKNKDGKCEETKDCSTYEATKPILCMVQKGNCGASLIQNANGSYTCDKYTPVQDCGLLTQTDCKYSFIDDDNLCWINAATNKCDKFNMNTCVGLPMEICADFGCDSSGTECKGWTCGSLIETKCTVADDGIFGAQTLCQWSTGQCIDRENLTGVTQDTCSKITDGGYYWSDDACVACEDESEDSSSPSLLVSLAALLVIIQ